MQAFTGTIAAVDLGPHGDAQSRRVRSAASSGRNVESVSVSSPWLTQAGTDSPHLHPSASSLRSFIIKSPQMYIAHIQADLEPLESLESADAPAIRAV